LTMFFKVTAMAESLPRRGAEGKVEEFNIACLPDCFHRESVKSVNPMDGFKDKFTI